MQKFLKMFTGVAVFSMLLTTVFTPHAFARTASSAVSEIEDATTAIKELKNDNSYNGSPDFGTDDSIETYFEDVSGITDDITAAIKSTNRPIIQSDYDKVESAYNKFTAALKTELRRVDAFITAGSDLQDTFDSERNSFEDDDSLDDAEKALAALDPTSSTSGSTTTTTTAKVESAAEDIDNAADDVKNLRDETADLETASDKSGDLEDLFGNFVDAADDVIDALKTITGTITAADVETITEAVDGFHKQIDNRFNQLDDLTGTGAALHSIRDEYTEQRSDYRSDQKDDISTQMDRIRKLAFGTSGGSALVSSTVNDIEEKENDVKDIEDEDAEDVVDDSDLEPYFSDITDVIQDVVSLVKKNTGTITQSDYDDLSEAVSNFKSAVTHARNEVRNNSSTEDYSDEYTSQKEDLDDELDDLDTALDNVEKNIGTVNTPGTGGTTSFFDVPAGSEFAAYISALSSRRIVTGYSDGSFHPKLDVTRAEFLKMALLAAGKNITQYQNAASTFQDVSLAHSLRPYINYASANSIVNGQTVGGVRYFYPERKISRAEAMIILMRINAIAPAASGTTTFTDVRDVEQGRYISVAASRGIINGYSATMFGPNDYLTREQAAKIVARTANFVQ